MWKLMMCIAVLCSGTLLCASSWKKLVPAGSVPDARYGHTIVKVGSKTYLFGGRSAVSKNSGKSVTYYNDLWVFSTDTNEFTLLSPTTTPPSTRYGHAAVSYDGKMYIFYGMGSDGNELNDIWYYDPASNSWNQVIVRSRAVPTARTDHRMVVVGNFAWLFGGRTNGTPNDGLLWRYDFANKEWASYAGKAARYGHAMFARGNKIYIYSGYTSARVSNDLWEYDIDINAWRLVSPTNIPSARLFSLVASDGDYVWLIGGTLQNGSDTVTNEVWKYDIVGEIFSQEKDSPFLTQAAGVLNYKNRASDVNVFVFGGLDENNNTDNQLWKFDSTQDDDDDDDDDDNDYDGTISCGATGIEFVLFFLALLSFRFFSEKKQ